MCFDHRLAPAITALGVAAALLSTGCAHKPTKPQNTIETAPAATISYEQDPALTLLDYARTLHEASPQGRADAVERARQRVDDAPGASSYARLALAYGTPGQRRYTPDEAARYAARALHADDAHWSTAAQQYLADLARLYADAARASDAQTATAAAPTDRAPTPRQPMATSATDTARVRALEQALDDARRKLRELANIEDRLSEPGS